jgi:hypothetical protein
MYGILSGTKSLGQTERPYFSEEALVYVRQHIKRALNKQI